MTVQLKRYGMDIAKWGFEVSATCDFKELGVAKNITCHNFRVVRFATKAEAMSFKTPVSSWCLTRDDLRMPTAPYHIQGRGSLARVRHSLRIVRPLIMRRRNGPVVWSVMGMISCLE